MWFKAEQMFQKKGWLEFYGSKKPNDYMKSIKAQCENVDTQIKGEKLLTTFAVCYNRLQDTGMSLDHFAGAVIAVEWVGQKPGPARMEVEKDLATQRYHVAVHIKLESDL